MEELQVIETTSGRQFKPWATKDDVQDPASVTAIASEIASGKQSIAAAINAKGGTADPLESFQQLADDIVNLNDSFITYGVEVTEKIHWLNFICNSTPPARLPLTEIDDDTVTEISQQNAFQNCTSLTKVVMNAVESISDSYAFNGCSALQEIEMPNLTTISGSYAFNGCSSLQRVEFPNLKTFRGSNAFIGASNLQYAIFPKLSVVSGLNIFYNGSGLVSIEFGTLTQLATPFSAATLSNLRNITIGQDTNINLPFQAWTANNVIAEGQSGIDELNTNIMTNLVPNLYLNGGKTLRLGAALYDVLTSETKDAITDRGWTLQRG